MKFVIFLLACLGASLAAPHPSKTHVIKRTLLDDLADLIALIDLDALLDVLNDELDTDPAVASVVEYLQSDGWNDLVDEVLAKPSAVDFIEYLNNAEIPVELILVAVRAIFDSATPGVEADDTASLRPFIEAVLGVLPLDDMVALLNDKLQNSPDVQDLYTVIASEDGKALVDEVLQMDEAIYIQEQLTAQEVDVAGVLATIYDFFGWGEPPKAKLRD